MKLLYYSQQDNWRECVYNFVVLFRHTSYKMSKLNNVDVGKTAYLPVKSRKTVWHLLLICCKFNTLIYFTSYPMRFFLSYLISLWVKVASKKKLEVIVKKNLTKILCKELKLLSVFYIYLFIQILPPSSEIMQKKTDNIRNFNWLIIW